MWGAGGDDPAGQQDRDAVGQLLRLGHVVGGEQDGRAARAQLGHQRVQFRARGHVQARGRLIQDHDRRVVSDGQREGQAAAQPDGELMILRGQLAAQPHPLQQIAPRGHAVVRGEEAQRLVHRHGVRQAAALELHTEQAAQLARLAGRVDAQDGQVAAVGLADPFQAFQCGGLARAVRPQQPEDLAGMRLEADVVCGDDGAVALAQVANLDDGWHGFTPPSSSVIRNRLSLIRHGDAMRPRESAFPAAATSPTRISSMLTPRKLILLTVQAVLSQATAAGCAG